MIFNVLIRKYLCKHLSKPKRGLLVRLTIYQQQQQQQT